jgi:hypothetical protein
LEYPCVADALLASSGPPLDPFPEYRGRGTSFGPPKPSAGNHLFSSKPDWLLAEIFDPDMIVLVVTVVFAALDPDAGAGHRECRR